MGYQSKAKWILLLLGVALTTGCAAEKDPVLSDTQSAASTTCTELGYEPAAFEYIGQDGKEFYRLSVDMVTGDVVLDSKREGKCVTDLEEEELTRVKSLLSKAIHCSGFIQPGYRELTIKSSTGQETTILSPTSFSLRVPGGFAKFEGDLKRLANRARGASCTPPTK